MPTQLDEKIPGPIDADKRLTRLFVGREVEIRQLTEAFSRIGKSGTPAEGILLYGWSGVGKSSLAEHILSNESNRKLMLAAGKSHWHKDFSSPFAVIHEATAELVSKILESPCHHQILGRIQDALTQDDSHILFRSFPAVAPLIPGIEVQTKRFNAFEDISASRCQGAYLQFLSAIASEDSPLVILLDDLQWADDASRKLVDAIMCAPGLKNFLMFGIVRNGEEDYYSPPKNVKMRVMVITLENLNEEEVNQIVAYSLDENPKTVKALGEIVFEKTVGNPFFVKQLLNAIHREGLLHWDGSATVWNSTEFAKQVRLFAGALHILADTIQHLDLSTQFVLVVAAMLGHTFQADILEALTSSIDLVSLFPAVLHPASTDLVDTNDSMTIGDSLLAIDRKSIFDSLSIAQAAGLIDQTSKRHEYRFTHDRVLEVAASLLPTGKLGRQIKSTLGGLMLELARANKSDDWIFYSAVNLIVKYGSSDLSSKTIASLCAEASLKSKTRSAFRSSWRFAEDGLRILGQKCWKGSSYEICLELFNLSAEGLFADGDLERSKRRVRSIMRHCRSVRDVWRARKIRLAILFAEEDFEACVDEARKGLQALGAKYPKKTSKFSARLSAWKIKRLLQGRSPQYVENLPRLDDADVTTISVCWLLNMMGRAAWRAGDFPLFLSTYLEGFCTVLTKGVSPEGSFFVSTYGFYLTVVGRLEQAYEYGRVAFRINIRLGVGNAVNRNSVVPHLCLFHLQEPLKNSRAPLQKALDSSVWSGDTHFACQLVVYLTTLNVYCGATLDRCASDFNEFQSLLEKNKNIADLAIAAPFAQFVETAMGKTRDPTILRGTFFNESEAIGIYESTGSPRNMHDGISVLYHLKMVLLYTLGEHRNAEAVRRQYTDSKYLKKAKKESRALFRLGQAGSPSSQALIPLLDAELLVCQGKAVQAIPLYEKSINLLNEAEFVLLHGIAYERLALCLRGLNSPSFETRLRKSLAIFIEFGMVSKVERMRLDYKTTFCSSQWNPMSHEPADEGMNLSTEAAS